MYPKTVGNLTSLWPYYKQLLRALTLVLYGVLFFLLAFFFISTFVATTYRDVAYRNLHPATRLCKEGLETGWTILSDVDAVKARDPSIASDKEFKDPSNNELYAVVTNPIWAKRFRCALQRHIIPNRDASDILKRRIEYYLGFLEYKENGEPYPLVQDPDSGTHQIPRIF